jgi:hypothetical protein
MKNDDHFNLRFFKQKNGHFQDHVNSGLKHQKQSNFLIIH